MARLAILGGSPVRKRLFPAYNPIGREEAVAVARVMATGNLSQYIGAWHADFMGGPEVRAFEKEWARVFNVLHALAVNSATSGLYATVAACGVGPGDEVIVSPYTMSASAVAAAVCGAVPVFADIDEGNFCLSAATIEPCITARTKAIVVVHIFGQSADMEPIVRLANQRGLRVIEDCAQAPLAQYDGRYVGGLGHVGVFSLNYHKHIHAGEGGVVTTNDPELAERIALIRNHGEAAIEANGRFDLAWLLGYNYRLTELQAAIGRCQLRKLGKFIKQRLKNVEYLNSRMRKLPGLVPVNPMANCRHVYYVQPVRYSRELIGVPRDQFVAAIAAELPSAVMRERAPLISAGYVRPLYLQPFYQKRTTLCAFSCPRYKGKVDYARGLCPVAERMHFEELITHEFMRPGMSHSDLDDVIRAFEKVYENLDELRAYKRRQQAGKGTRK